MQRDIPYEFGQDALRERERLAAVERAFDGFTQSVLTEVGVLPGWRCWEIGAGGGSIARWLATVVGSAGHVLASDANDHWFDAGTADIAFVRHDVVAEPVPEDSFDLIHARFLMEHLPQPDQVIERLRSALRPRGVLVLEDSGGLELTTTPATAAFEPLRASWEAAGSAVGWNASYGRDLMRDLRASGLTELGGREWRQVAPGGDGWAHVRYGLERLRPQLADQGVGDVDLRRALQCLADPTMMITGPPVVIAWGRR
jgi:SAM-dependent methyltransferase